jgi:hypothetical protein
MADEHLRAEHNHRDRREVATRIVGHLGQQRLDDEAGRRGDQQSVTVGCSFRRQIVADYSAGAGAVIHHDLLAPRFGEALGNHPGHAVGCTSSRVGHDDPDWAHRILLRLRPGLRQCNAGYQQKSSDDCNIRKTPRHDILLAPVITAETTIARGK